MLARLTTLVRRYWPAMLLFCAMVTWVLYQFSAGWQQRHLVAQELARLRSLGIPTSADELTLFVASHTTNPNATSAWKIPLDAIEAGSIGRPPYGLRALDDPGHQPPLPGEDWDELPHAEEYIARHASIYRDIDAATATPGECTLVVDFSEGAMMLLPYVDASYRIMNLLRLRAYVHLHHGESAAAARDVEALLRAATMHRLEPVSVSQSIVSRHVDLGLQSLERFLPYIADDEETLQRMQQHLETIDMLESLRLAAIGDRVLGLTTLDNPSTAGAGRVPPRLYSAWVRDSKHELLETLKDLDRRFSGPWPAPLQDIRDYPIPANRDEDVVSPWGGTEWFAPSDFARQRVKAVESFARTQARAEAAATAIASIRFEKQQGHWPTDVKELVPEFLDEPPLDPFTGDVLVLRKKRDSIRIYSVGPNLKDDGGVESSDQKQAPTGSPDVVFRLRLPAKNGN